MKRKNMFVALVFGVIAGFLSLAIAPKAWAKPFTDAKIILEVNATEAMRVFRYS